jgi:hypothetical protein
LFWPRAWRWSSWRRGYWVRKDNLIAAAGAGDLDRVNTLLAAGAEVNAGDKLGWTALMDASRNGRLEVAQALLGAKANVYVGFDEDGVVCAVFGPDRIGVAGSVAEPAAAKKRESDGDRILKDFYPAVRMADHVCRRVGERPGVIGQTRHIRAVLRRVGGRFRCSLVLTSPAHDHPR